MELPDLQESVTTFNVWILPFPKLCSSRGNKE
jgi:hypothetical protein